MPKWGGTKGSKDALGRRIPRDKEERRGGSRAPGRMPGGNRLGGKKPRAGVVKGTNEAIRSTIEETKPKPRPKPKVKPITMPGVVLH